MKRRNLIILILVTSVVTVFIVLSQVFGLLGARDPRIVFEATTIDFGEKEEGDEAVCSFAFKNKGNKTLILKGAKTSCGCLLAEPSKVEISPGENSELTATYDTLGRNGDVKSTVLLFTNDPNAEVVRLTIIGNIKKPYIYNPRSIDFGEARAEEFAEKTVVITKLTKREMEVTDVETSKPWLRASLISRDEGNVQEGLSTGSYQLTVSIAADAPIGPIREEVVISLLMKSSNPIRNIRIPAKGYVQGDLDYEPKTIFWSTVTKGQTPAAEITIESNTGSKVEVRDVTSKKGLVKINGLYTAGASTHIRVELKKDLDMDFVSDVLIITTGSEEIPQIKVPVYARITREKRQNTVVESVMKPY